MKYNYKVTKCQKKGMIAMKKKVFLYACISIIAICSVINIYAYNLSGDPMPNPVFTVRNLLNNTYMSQRLQASLGYWNNTPTKTGIYTDSGSVNKIAFDKGLPSDTPLGYTLISQSGNPKYFEMYLNYNYLPLNQSVDNDKRNEYVITHEFGHTLGLDENGYFDTRISVMSEYSDLRTYYWPQQDDIDGVNAVYP